MAPTSGSALQTKFFYVASIFAVSFGIVSLMWQFKEVNWILIVFGLAWVIVVTAFAWEIVTRAERLDAIVRSRTDALEESNRHLNTLLEQLSAFQAISYEMNQRIAVADVTRAFTERLVKLLPEVDAAWLWLDRRLLRGTGDGGAGRREGAPLALVAHAGEEFGMPEELTAMRASSPLVARCFDGRTISVDHALSTKAAGWGWDWLEAAEMESFAGFPLRLGRTTFGVLGVFSRHRISAEFTSQLRLSVNQLTVALEKGRLLKQTQKRAEELAAANEELRQLDAMKDWFVSAVSHELRTPLTNIRSFGEILENYEDLAPNERVEFAGIIRQESERLSGMIDDLLDLAKIANGEVTLRLAYMDLGPLVEKCCKLFSQEAEERRIKFGRVVARDAPKVYADEQCVTRVLNNLIGNAFKFTPDGGSIAVAVQPGGPGREGQGHVTVLVNDTGLGIAPRDQQRIFERFTQVGSRLTEKKPGTGIGLAICKELVQMSGGQIWVRSEPGKGSTFGFTLPARPWEEAPAKGGGTA